MEVIYQLFNSGLVCLILWDRESAVQTPHDEECSVTEAGRFCLAVGNTGDVNNEEGGLFIHGDDIRTLLERAAERYVKTDELVLDQSGQFEVRF